MPVTLMQQLCEKVSALSGPGFYLIKLKKIIPSADRNVST